MPGRREQREPVAAPELLYDQWREQRGRGDHDAHETVDAGRPCRHPDQKQQHEGRNEHRRTCSDDSEQERCSRRGSPASRGGDDRQHERGQQDVGNDRAELTLPQRDEEGRGCGPDDRSDGRSPTPGGESGRAQPCGERCERQREQVDQHDTERRIPEGDGAEHGEHVRERIGGPREARADVTPAVAHV